MKRTYEKPIFLEQNIGFANKFQSGYSEKMTTKIDGVPIKDIMDNFGSPVFVFSEKTIRETIRKYNRAFKTYYPKIVFAWSYKTNYLGAICSVLHSEGSIAEVVSEFEYEKARNIGVAGDRIIFNGPYKRSGILKQAVEENAIINIDNFDEIYRIEEIALQLNKKVDVGIRINMNSGIYPQWTRFGFNYESGQAFSAAKRIAKSDNLNLTGIHCHMGTYIVTTKAYVVETIKLVEFMNILETQLDVDIEYLDLGGGFPSKNRLKGVYLPPDFTAPTIEEYAKAIGETLLANISPDKFPTVYLESGRAIIDEAGYLLTSVTASKRLVDGRKTYILDAGVNFLFTTTWYDIPVKIGIEIEGPAEDVTLYGPLCMNIDVVRDNVKLPPLSPGTPLVFNPVGAYCVTQWMQFIEYRPNVVMISESGEVEIIREAETLEDVIGRERIPERLTKFEL